MSHTFATKVVGVSHKNPDGSRRQLIVYNCQVGESVDLIREPDNPYDEDAIGVFRKNGEQIGYIAQHVACHLASFMDFGGEVKAKIIKILGAPKSTWEHIKFALMPNPMGCVIEITKGSIPYSEKENTARDLIDKAKSIEKIEPERALSLYSKAVQVLKDVDRIASQTLAYRRKRIILRNTRHPINRITMVLEKLGRFEECLSSIDHYEKSDDKVGLTKGDSESISKRKKRIVLKIGQQNK